MNPDQFRSQLAELTKGLVGRPPGSAHRPTVSQGRAPVLHLLPQGAIEFSP